MADELVTSCNKGHIAISWTYPEVCPLCACYARMAELEQALLAAASSLATIAYMTGLEDLRDVCGYANSRCRVACQSLMGMQNRCKCGHLSIRHRDGVRECQDCYCSKYEHQDDDDD